jgi:hypothetical protein
LSNSIQRNLHSITTDPRGQSRANLVPLLPHTAGNSSPSSAKGAPAAVFAVRKNICNYGARHFICCKQKIEKILSCRRAILRTSVRSRHCRKRTGVPLLAVTCVVAVCWTRTIALQFLLQNDPSSSSRITRLGGQYQGAMTARRPGCLGPVRWWFSLFFMLNSDLTCLQAI